MKQIRSRFVSNPDFDPEKIKVVSSACEGLCRWILAIEKYDVSVFFFPSAAVNTVAAAAAVDTVAVASAVNTVAVASVVNTVAVASVVVSAFAGVAAAVAIVVLVFFVVFAAVLVAAAVAVSFISL